MTVPLLGFLRMVSKTLQAFFFSLLLVTSTPIIASRVIMGHGFDSSKSSPFLFLKYLQGCHKGDHVEGIHDLKIYLQRYGYLSNVQTQIQSPATDYDTFDDLLESAIKTYQKNFDLNVSGILDAETIAQMSQPRCGVPDFFNGTTWMRSGNETNQHSQGHGHFHMVSHHAFFPGNPKWPHSKYHLTYTFINNYPSYAIAPVTRAFSRWASNSQFTFSQTWDSQTADIRISFERRDHGDGSPFDGKWGALAHAFPPTDGRIHFDADETWTVGAVFDAFDVETVALHEIGHILGLAHTSLRDAIMFPITKPGSTKGLSLDDIVGVRALYK